MELDPARRTTGTQYSESVDNRSRLESNSKFFFGKSVPAKPGLATTLPRLVNPSLRQGTPKRLHHEDSITSPGHRHRPNQGFKSAYDEIQTVNINGKHQEVYEHFEANPTELNQPYKVLESNRYVLELDEDGKTIFHMLAKKISVLGRSRDLWEGQKEHWVEGLDKIAAWVLHRNPALFGPSTGHGSDSEPKALEFCCTKGGYVAYAMLNLLLDQKTQDIMRSKCQGESCRNAIPHPLIAYLKDINENENGCCHTYEKETRELHGKLQEELRNAALDRQTKMHCLHHIVEHYCANPQPDAVEKLIVLSGEAIVQEAGNNSESVLHLAIKKFRAPNTADFDALVSLAEVIQAILRIYPSSLYTKNRKGNTAYQELIEYQKAQDSSADKFRDLRNDILEVFKKAYIGDPIQSHINKIGYLYPSGAEERMICLNLGNEHLGKNYVQVMINRHLDRCAFETCLSYVSLPARNRVQFAKGKPDSSDYLETYKIVFDFLGQRKKVKKIFRLIVNDRSGPPHSDKAIIELTKRFHIEHWEWKKFDISSDTICEAAPNAVSVVLFSSGNISALQSWSCKHGLAKLQKVEMINVYIQRGIEDESTLETHRKKFLDRINARFKKIGRNVQVNAEIVDAEYNSDLYRRHLGQSDITMGTQARRNHDWLIHMGKFTREIQNFEDFPAGKMPIIKVALLDDGINLQKANFNVRLGRTFSDTGDTGLDHYYVDPGQHGTVMGRLITDMCCNMQLYVARIERSSASGIPQRAAAAAVKWALRENVDIISMSWTIPKNDSENCFKDAIAEAVKQNKLLFCALREEENALIHDGYHPVGLPQVFKIGSATRAGNQVNTHSGDDNHVDFILPGLDVLDEDEGCKSLNGSSVATALASGLAALILYCAELVDQDAEETGRPQKYAQSLRDVSKMKLVFKRLSDQSHNRKFPEVQRFFNVGKSLSIDEIKDLIVKIAPT